MTQHIHTSTDPRVFVFGSNLMGIHGAGAAKYAYEELGYPWALSEGLLRRAYALPTCRAPGKPLPLRGSVDTVEHYVDRFLTVACSHPDLRFFVSAVGCGFAGYTEAEIAPLFANAPENCDIPPEWKKS